MIEITANSVDIIGYLAGIFLMISYLPQLLRTIKTRQTDDISILLLCCTMISGILYEVYALLLSLYPVVIMNGIFLLLVTGQFVLTVKYRKAIALAGDSKGPSD